METVLIVDDDVLSRERIKHIFSKKNYRIEEADSGKSALELMENSPVDIILLDVDMPNQNGFEICLKIKSTQKLEMIPIIFITGADNIEDKAKGFNVGGNDYITKPINSDEVRIRIQAHLRIKQAETERIELAAATASADAEKKRATELENAYKELKETQAKLIQTGKMTALGTLSAGIVHQLSQPLTGILCYTQLLLSKTKKDQTDYEDLKIIEDSTRYMVDILNNIKGFARQTKSEKKKADINESLKKTVQITSEQLYMHEINLVKKFEPNLPKVYIDDNQMRQIFFNFIVNAQEAMECMPKDVKKELTIISRPAPDKKAVDIIFSDTGLGIPEGIKERIFEPFFTTKNEKGTGLGLSLTYGMIKEHGGTIALESKEGKGTTFRITLPAAKTD